MLVNYSHFKLKEFLHNLTSLLGLELLEELVLTTTNTHKNKSILPNTKN